MDSTENLDLLVKVYNQNLGSDKMEDYLLENFNKPYETSLKETYEKNRLSLTNYRFWKRREALSLPDFDSLNVKMLTDGKGKFYILDTKGKMIPPPLES